MRTILAFGAIACIAGPALAACPDLPVRATYDSGMTVEVVERGPDVLTYRQTITESGKVTEMVVQAGLFTLSATRDGAGAEFDWKTELPGTADLVPGASFTAEAVLTTPGLLPPRPFRTEVRVIGEEKDDFAGCTYPVMKIEVENFEGGQSIGLNTKWLHLPSLVVMRSVIEEHGESRAQEVTALE